MTTNFSGKQINRAGEKLISHNLDPEGEEFADCVKVLSYWRSAHEEPLRIAFDELQKTVVAQDSSAIFAKRLKRSVSIYMKLIRFDKMKLKNIQDIGGCRAIVANEKQLRKVVRDLKKLPEVKNIPGRYRTKDYIKRPKSDGYRSYHIVGKFLDLDGNSKSIEIQLRTRIQHYWATAVEIVDLFTGQALKSSLGEERWREFFSEISQQMALIERISSFSQLDEKEKFKRYLSLLEKDESLLEQCFRIQGMSDSISVMEKFTAFAESLKAVDDRLTESIDAGFVLLKIDTINGQVSSKIFSNDDGAVASNEYTVMETEASSESGVVVALVSSSAVGGIKEAYPNYFADSSEFLEILTMVNGVKDPKQQNLRL